MACFNDKDFNTLYLVCDGGETLDPRVSSCIQRTLIERFSYEERKEFVSRTKDGCAPLFVASKNGNLDIVKYLIEYCGADIEQRGFYRTLPLRMFKPHSVSPLWCATVQGKLDVVKYLLDSGAQVNSVSNFASTPVQCSYLMTPYEIQVHLGFHDDDIFKPVCNGVTCLMASVQSVPLCECLIANGAEVNAEDANGQTALHYAIQRRNFETTKLLLEKGADPLIKSRNGDDALQTACLVCAPPVFDYLCERYQYSNERIAEAHELMGSSFLFEHRGISDAKHHWRTALEIRYNNPHERYEKKCLSRDMPYNAVEFTTVEELDNLVLDLDAFRIQSLLVAERILGPLHPNMHTSLMLCSFKIMGNHFLKGLDLWRYTLDLFIQKNGLLHMDTCFMAQKLVVFFLELHKKHSSGLLNEKIQFMDVSDSIRLLVDGLKESFKILLLEYQLVNLDIILKVLTHLFLILSIIPKSSQEVTCMKNLIGSVLRMDARSSTGEPFLHLLISKDNFLHPETRFTETQVTELLKLCLECGAQVDAVDNNLCTPLHIASLPMNFNPGAIKLLLEYGAHVDRRNSTGEWPRYMLQSISDCPGEKLQYVTLKCLAARKVVEEKMLYKGKVPRELEEFIRIH